MLNRILCVLCFLLATFSLEAASLQLQNETHYTLRAVVLGADGSHLGETQVLPQKTIRWYSSKQDTPAQGPSKSITPMTIQWFCEDDEVFWNIAQVYKKKKNIEAYSDALINYLKIY